MKLSDFVLICMLIAPSITAMAVEDLFYQYYTRPANERETLLIEAVEENDLLRVRELLTD